MKRSWGRNSEYSTTVIYMAVVGGSTTALLVVLGLVRILEWVGI